MQGSELLLKTFSSAAASSACEQCCCVTHMQLPEMLCNGRRQGGGELGSPAEGPGGLLQSREGCCSSSLSSRPLEESLLEELGRPRLPAPSHRHCNRRTWGGLRALLADFGRRQPEGGKALTHSATGPTLVLVSVHTLPFRVTSYLLLVSQHSPYCTHRTLLALSQAHREWPQVPLLGKSQSEAEPLWKYLLSPYTTCFQLSSLPLSQPRIQNQHTGFQKNLQERHVLTNIEIFKIMCLFNINNFYNRWLPPVGTGSRHTCKQHAKAVLLAFAL